MKKASIASSLATVAAAASAQSAAPDAAAHDHEHAAGSAAAPAAAPSSATPAGRTRSRPAGTMAGTGMMDMSGATQDALAKLDTQIAALRAMHARLQAAPSAEARRALRAEQMQLVQQSLALADATPVPAMPMMPGGMMNGRAERGMGPAQRSAGEASGSTSQPMAGGTMHEPMRGGMPAGGGMAG